MLHFFLTVTVFLCVCPLPTYQQNYDDAFWAYSEAVKTFIDPKNNALESLANYKNLSQHLINSGLKLAPLIQSYANGSLLLAEGERYSYPIWRLGLLHKEELKHAGFQIHKNLAKLSIIGNEDKEISYDILKDVDYLVTFNGMFSLFLENNDWAKNEPNFKFQMANALKGMCAKPRSPNPFSFFAAFEWTHAIDCHFLDKNDGLHKIDKAFNELMNCSFEKSKPENDNGFNLMNTSVSILYYMQSLWHHKEIVIDSKELCELVKKNETLSMGGKTNVLEFLRQTIDQKYGKHIITFRSVSPCPAAIALTLNGHSNEAKEQYARILLNHAAMVLDTSVMCYALNGFVDEDYPSWNPNKFNDPGMIEVFEYFEKFLKNY